MAKVSSGRPCRDHAQMRRRSLAPRPPSSFFFLWSFWWPGRTQPNLREAVSNRTIKYDSQSRGREFPRPHRRSRSLLCVGPRVTLRTSSRSILPLSLWEAQQRLCFLIRPTLAFDSQHFPQHFIMKTSRRTATLKELDSEHAYTHYLDTPLTFYCTYFRISVHASFRVIFLCTFQSKLQAAVFFSLNASVLLVR